MRKSIITIVALFIGFSAATRAAEPDTAAANIALIRGQHESLNRGEWKAASRDFAVDTLNFGHPAGRAVIARILEDIYRTFPDFRLDITDIWTKGESVVVRCKESGTHHGVGQLPVNGGLLVGVAPTEKHFEVEAVHIYAVRDGKIVDHVGVRSDLEMMQQLGLLADPKPFDWAKFTAEANKH
jgi:predicted ester cyclase